MFKGGVAFRQPREPRPALTITFASLDTEALEVARLLRQAIRNKQCPVHLFVSRAGGVFLVAETHPAAARWPMEHFAWFVGTYAYVHRGADSMLRPDDEGIREDLEEHMADLIPAEHRLVKRG